MFPNALVPNADPVAGVDVVVLPPKPPKADGADGVPAFPNAEPPPPPPPPLPPPKALDPNAEGVEVPPKALPFDVPVAVVDDLAPKLDCPNAPPVAADVGPGFPKAEAPNADGVVAALAPNPLEPNADAVGAVVFEPEAGVDPNALVPNALPPLVIEPAAPPFPKADVPNADPGVEVWLLAEPNMLMLFGADVPPNVDGPALPCPNGVVKEPEVGAVRPDSRAILSCSHRWIALWGSRSTCAYCWFALAMSCCSSAI